MKKISSTNIVSYLESLSFKIWKSKWKQYLLFGIATAITINIMGYHFGSFDQVVHIPFLKKFADPTVYPNDHFLDLRHYHYSFFWFFFIPLYRAGVLEISMFLIYIVTTYLTFWALWSLSKTLFNNPLTSFLAILVFSIPHLTFGTVPIFEFSLLNRTFVVPFLFIALNLYFKKQYIVSFFLLGLLYNLHVISVNFVIFLFLFDSILRVRQIGLKNIMTRIGLFIIGALPVLIWKFNSTPVALTANWEWFSTISNGMLSHLFYFNTQFYLTILTLGGISTIVLFFIAKHSISNTYLATVTNFIYAGILVLLVAFATSLFYPSVIIIQSQVIRITLFVMLFSYLYFIQYTVELKKNKIIDPSHFLLLIIGLFLSVSPIIPLAFWFILKYIKNIYAYFSSFIVLAFILSLLFYLILKLNVWKPGIHVFPEQTARYDIEVWAKNNTPKNAIFITPPYLWGFYEPEWRAIAERSTLITLYDLMEIAFVPSYINFWKSRFADIAPGALEQFKGNVFENIQITKKAYSRLTTDDFIRLAKKYGVSYVLVEKPSQYNLPVSYENEGYVLYKLNPTF